MAATVSPITYWIEAGNDDVLILPAVTFRTNSTTRWVEYLHELTAGSMSGGAYPP
jgi:hypothetical protein